MKFIRCNILFLFILFLSLHPSFGQDAAFDWQRKGEFKGGKLEGAVSFSIGEKRYVCLGSDGNNYKKECWEYIPKNSSWARIADFPGDARINAVAFTIGEKGYVGTGQTMIGTSFAAKKDFWMYNPLKDLWTKIEDLPGDARCFAVGFSIGDKGYVALGQPIGKTYLCSDLWEYSPSTSQWTKKSDFPEKGGREEASVFVANGSAYVLLGKTSSLKDLVKPKQKNAFEYNPKNDKWSASADFLGSARVGAISFSINNKGYICAGSDGLSKRFNDMWEFDPKKNKWEQKADAEFSPRHSSFWFVVDNRIYIGGGNITSKVTEMGGASDLWCGTAKPEKVIVDYNAKLIYEDKNRKMPLSQQGVSLIGLEKKVIQTTKTDNKGLFVFKELDAAGKYELVLDRNDKLPANAIVSITKPSGKIIQNLKKNEDGLFSYEIPDLNVSEEDDSYFNLKNFASSTEKNITITSNIIYLQSSWEITKEAEDLLYQVIVSLNQFPQLELEISSHTDSNGDDASNMQLSEMRAKAVVDYILSYGVEAKRVKGKGYGETMILNKCKNSVECSEEEHKLNRRTEFKFIKTQ